MSTCQRGNLTNFAKCAPQHGLRRRVTVTYVLMSARFYACFVVRGSSSRCRDLGNVIEVDNAIQNCFETEDVAELVAKDLQVGVDAVQVYHLGRLH